VEGRAAPVGECGLPHGLITRVPDLGDSIPSDTTSALRSAVRRSRRCSWGWSCRRGAGRKSCSSSTPRFDPDPYRPPPRRPIRGQRAPVDDRRDVLRVTRVAKSTEAAQRQHAPLRRSSTTDAKAVVVDPMFFATRVTRNTVAADRRREHVAHELAASGAGKGPDRDRGVEASRTSCQRHADRTNPRSIAATAADSRSAVRRWWSEGMLSPRSGTRVISTVRRPHSPTGASATFHFPPDRCTTAGSPASRQPTWPARVESAAACWTRRSDSP